MGYYSEELETEMLKFYDSLREKDRHRYAAIEAKKLGHGGLKYISELFGCHRNTITEGKNEIESTVPEKFNEKAIRVRGGGRKSYFEKIPELDQAFQRVVQEHTAGDPMQAEIKPTFSRLFRTKKNNCGRKCQETANRNEQFENINCLKQEYKDTGNPIMSTDTKKR